MRRKVVNDVNPALFSGANGDSRSDSFTNGTHRLFVLGKRINDTASDSKIYSRALQAYTTHYYRVTCGSSVSTGSFQTANIPIGNTYSDTPVTTTPTISPTDRSQKIIDAHTGALLRRVSLRGDQVSVYSSSNGPFPGYGAMSRMCGHTLAGPDNGYLCAFVKADGGYGLFYYIIPSTGEARFLGSAIGEFDNLASQPKIDPIDNKIYIVGQTSVIRYTYNGD